MVVGPAPAELLHLFLIWLFISSDAGVAARREKNFNDIVLDGVATKSAVHFPLGPVGPVLLHAFHHGHLAHPQELLPHHMVAQNHAHMFGSNVFAPNTKIGEDMLNPEDLDAELYAREVLSPNLGVKLAVFWDEEFTGVTKALRPTVEEHGLKGLAKEFVIFLAKHELNAEAAKAGTFQRAVGDSLAASWAKHYATPNQKAMYIMGRAVQLTHDSALTIELATVDVGEELLGYWFPGPGKIEQHQHDRVLEELVELVEEPSKQFFREAEQAADALRLLSVQTMFVALAARGDCSLMTETPRWPASKNIFDRHHLLKVPKGLPDSLASLDPGEQKVALSSLAVSDVQCKGFAAAAKWDNFDELTKMLDAALRHKYHS